MEWKDVSGAVGAVAPTLGRLLGGLLPIPFGSELGSAAGSAIAAALGVDPTPEAVNQALGATPNDVKIAQLKELEEDAKAKWSALANMAQADATVGVAEVDATSKTIAAELINGTWYQRMWRPTIMLVWAATLPFQIGTILYHVWQHDPATISSLASMVYALSAWNATPAAVAGVYAYGRTQEKIAAVDKQ